MYAPNVGISGPPQTRSVPITHVRILLAAGALWLTLIATGIAALWQYSERPGKSSQAPNVWPADSAIARDATLPTLIFSLHPQCPCSSASLEELARLIRFVPGRVAVEVLVLTPSTLPDEWSRTPLVEAARAIPGVRIHCDPDGRECARFGAQTSGEVALYDVNGQLRFHGGITAARGHAGDNAGVSAILAVLNGAPPQRDDTPVFGCPLRGPADRPDCCKPAALEEHQP